MSCNLNTPYLGQSCTSVYPAKGRPGSGTTKMDSGAQKRLRRSRIEGYGPRPQARARLARAEVGQGAGVRAYRRPLHNPALVARANFLKSGYLAPFSQFLHIMGLNFPHVFYPFTSTYDTECRQCKKALNMICWRTPWSSCNKWLQHCHSEGDTSVCNEYKCKKLQFIHSVNGDGSKTAKIIKRQC